MKDRIRYNKVSDKIEFKNYTEKMPLKGLTVSPPHGHIYMRKSRMGNDDFGPSPCRYIVPRVST